MNEKTNHVVGLLGLTTTPASDADEPKPVPSFDGGARRDQPAPASPDHGQWLTALLRGEKP